METLIAHEIEPELTNSPPRAVGLPWRTQALLGLAGALSFLLFVGGTRALFEAARLCWVALAGRPAIAHLTAIDMAPAGPGQPGGPLGVHYAYRDPFTGKSVVRYAPVGAAPTEDNGQIPGLGMAAKTSPPPVLRVGDALTLRIAGRPGHESVYVWTPAPGGKVLFLILCGGAVVAVSLRLMVVLRRWQRVRVRLLHAGQAVVGTIIHKQTEFGDTPRYLLRYGYATVSPAELREHEEQVNPEQWKRYEIGQPVTVLYDPAAPAVAGLYALMR